MDGVGAVCARGEEKTVGYAFFGTRQQNSVGVAGLVNELLLRSWFLVHASSLLYCAGRISNDRTFTFFLRKQASIAVICALKGRVMLFPSLFPLFGQ